MDRLKADICIIGGGSAGLSIAAGAAQMGARTVLIEVDRMGGDCLNSGCVPSKALLSAANWVHEAQNVEGLGAGSNLPDLDFARVHDRVHEVIATIAPRDSEDRFTNLGCTVIRARARFVDRNTIEVAGRHVSARRFVIATGSRPAIPAIPGLDQVDYFTTRNLFENKVRPPHLAIIGGGPVAVEMAQAYGRLESKVTVLARGAILAKEDPEAAAVVRRSLQADGVTIVEHARVLGFRKDGTEITVTFADVHVEHMLAATHILVATGRLPNVEGLELATAGVRLDARGIMVDPRMRTSNHRIYAAGDVAGGPYFTHLAEYHAGIILQNALFHVPARADLTALPRTTFTEPELAQVGMTEAQARAVYGTSLRILRMPFAEIDRAQTDGSVEGFAKVMIGRRSRVVGATIVGRNAGELLLPWTLAVSRKVTIGSLARVIVSYPSLSEITKRLAGSYYTPRLFSPWTHRLVRFMSCFG